MLMKKVAIIVLVLTLVVAVSQKADAKCEAALARLKQAEADLAAANAEYDKASKEYNKAQADLNKAVQNINAIAAKLGASGKATKESVAFGRSLSNPTFFDNPEYKAAKQAWQNAKAANEQAEGRLDQAGIRRKRAQGEYDEAKAEYERLRAQHIGDAGYLREPEELKIDESLSKKVERVIGTEKSHITVKQDDTYFDISFSLKKLKDKTILETCIIGKGKEARHRKWIPKNPGLIIDSTAIDPFETYDYYITQVSKGPAKRTTAAGASPSVTKAFGKQYVGGVKQPAHYGGAACPTGTSQESGKTKSWGSMIGSAGLTSALGLLTSRQPMRERITKEKTKGLKSSFDITGYEDKLKDAKFKTDLVNEAGGNVVEIVVPARFYKEDFKSKI